MQQQHVPGIFNPAAAQAGPADVTGSTCTAEALGQVLKLPLHGTPYRIAESSWQEKNSMHVWSDIDAKFSRLDLSAAA